MPQNIFPPMRRIAVACSTIALALAAGACSTSPAAEPAGTKMVSADKLRPASRVRASLNSRDFHNAFPGGTTVLRLAIGADGKVGDIRIVESSGNAAVDAAAARSLVGAAFVPYREDGVAIPVTTLMPVRFPASGCILARPLDC